MTRPLAAALVALLLAATPGLAQSGEQGGERDDLSAGVQALLNLDLKIGPFFVQPEIGVEGGWQSVPNARGRDGDIPTDILVRPHGRLALVLPFRTRHELSASGRVHYDWYEDFDTLRTFTTTLRGGYRYDSERFRFEVGDTYIDGQNGRFNPVEVDGESVDQPLDVDDLVDVRTNSVNANIEWDFRPRVFLHLRGNQGFTEYAEGQQVRGRNLAARLNRDTWGVGGTLGYELNSRMTVAAHYDRRTDSFDDPDNIRNNDNDRIAGQIQLDPNPRFQLDLLAGVRRFRPLREEDEFSGLSAEGTLTLVPGGRAEMVLTGERDVQLAFFDENSHFVRLGGGYSLLFAINRAVRVGGDVSYHEHDYPVVVSLAREDGSILTAARLDELLSYGGRLEWRLGRRLGRIVTRVGWFERDSNFDEFDLDGLTLRAGYAFAY